MISFSINFPVLLIYLNISKCSLPKNKKKYFSIKLNNFPFCICITGMLKVGEIGFSTKIIPIGFLILNGVQALIHFSVVFFLYL